MYITKIRLQNFRNYDQEEIIIEPNINLFYGDNAQGKTNLLESIFISALGKSFKTNQDKEVIKLGESFAKIEVDYQKSDRKGTVIIIISNKKEIYLNDIKVKKLSEILGNIHIVLFTPEDMDILKKMPNNRRKFLNMMIGQLRPKYIYVLNQYLKVLEQRNNLLRQIKYGEAKSEQLDVWNEKLVQYGYEIANYRNEFINKIKNKINLIHKNITEDEETIEINYVTDCINRDKYIQQLKSNQKIDITKGFTTKGVHRDDFSVSINGQDVGIYGSQGQNRTAILSLKLSELQIIYDEIGEYPILLLDDFMSELDAKRRKKFLDNIQDTQVIITGTDKININKKISIYKVINGKVKKMILKNTQ